MITQFILAVSAFLLLGLAIVLQLKNRKLSSQLNKFEEFDKLKQSFIHNLIHDLKGPTNAQISTLKMLKEETFGKLNEEQLEMIALTQNVCQYTKDLIATILESYNVERDDMSLQKDSLDMVDLVASVVENFKTLAMSKDQTIKLQANCCECFVYGDKLLLHRVLSNLINNALTYGFKHTDITVSLNYCAKGLDICVKNTSVPISAEELSTIFEKFKTTKISVMNSTSTGLGLYISKCIVEKHEGEVYTDSYSDGTCIFGFIIPTEETYRAAI